jgi:hypothetical protein
MKRQLKILEIKTRSSFALGVGQELMAAVNL